MTAIELFQATAGQEIELGPFLSDTDGKTPMTGLTIANTDIKIWKGGTTLATKNSGGATHMADGVYYAVMDEVDTNTGLVPFIVHVHVSGALPVKTACKIIDPDQHWRERQFWMVATLVAQATGTPTTTTIPITLAYPTATASAQNGTYAGMAVVSALGATASRVTAYNGTTKTLTVHPPLPVAPSAGDLFVLMPAPGGISLADDALTAAKVAADAVTEIQSGLATAAALTTVQNYVDELESRLTVARAGYLDNLSAGAVATAAALTALQGLVDDLEGRLTAARAGYLDNLNSGVPLSAAAVDAILDEAVEGALTLRQATRLMLATLVGKAAGGGTSTITYRDMADTKNRITLTTDANGNRTAVSRDAT